MKGYLKILLIIVVSLIAGSYLHKCQSPPGNIPDRTECITDTLTVYDTISYKMPKPQSEQALDTRRYTLPIYCFSSVAGSEPLQRNATESLCVDTLITSSCYGTGAGGEPRCSNDSAIVELPIIQQHYADSTYEAWVSGPIDPRLDSIRVFAPTTIITKREWEPPKRWHIGPTIGYGFTPQGLQPYIGISITYSIISW